MIVKVYRVEDERCELCSSCSRIRRIEFKANKHTFDYTLCKSCCKDLLDALYADALYEYEDEK